MKKSSRYFRVSFQNIYWNNICCVYYLLSLVFIISKSLNMIPCLYFVTSLELICKSGTRFKSFNNFLSSEITFTIFEGTLTLLELFSFSTKVVLVCKSTFFEKIRFYFSSRDSIFRCLAFVTFSETSQSD